MSELEKHKLNGERCMSDFEQWFEREPMPKSYKDMAGLFYRLNKELSRLAWDHQQKQITTLKTQLAQAQAQLEKEKIHLVQEIKKSFLHSISQVKKMDQSKEYVVTLLEYSFSGVLDRAIRQLKENKPMPPSEEIKNEST